MPKIARVMVAAILAAGLLSCGGSGGGGGSSTSMLTVALTDAASDEISTFLVDITSIQLTRWSGAVTSVLAAPVTVDLAELTDMSRVINALAVTPGWYTSGAITLDFTNAQCVLNGKTTAATLLDADGNAITGTLTLPLQFGTGALNAIAGRHRIMELDFDLDQSATVDAANNTVTLDSTFVMRVDRSDPKSLVTVGTLVGVDDAAGTFTAEVKRPGGSVIATVTFAANGLTVYQIDGVPSLGAAGLVALKAMPAGTWIQTYGAINPAALRINVFYVEAGTGTYNGGTDIVEGHITGRTGGAGVDATLTVLGHSNNAAHDAFQFNTSFTVSTSFANTKVLRRGGILAYDTDDLNIGQRVRVFGALTGTAMDATAAASVVRMQPVRVFGLAGGAPAGGVLTIDLSRVDLRLQGAFTWSQGGTTPPDPAALTLKVFGLADGLGIGALTAVEALGYFRAVDDDTEDFAAVSVTNRDAAPSLLRIRDLVGGLAVVTTTSATQIQFTLAGTALPGEAALLDRGFAGVTDLPAVSTVKAAPGFTLYAIRNALTGSVQLYLNFSEFSTALGAALTVGRSLRGFGAVGIYDAGEAAMTASLATANVR